MIDAAASSLPWLSYYKHSPPLLRHLFAMSLAQCVVAGCTKKATLTYQPTCSAGCDCIFKGVTWEEMYPTCAIER